MKAMSCFEIAMFEVTYVVKHRSWFQKTEKNLVHNLTVPFTLLPSTKNLTVTFTYPLMQSKLRLLPTCKIQTLVTVKYKDKSSTDLRPV